MSSSVITSDRVNGTPVLGPDGRQVGTIYHLVIEKVGGRVTYAVMSFGGFLGMGQDHHPIPWAALRYDPDLGGYVTGITADQLQAAPAGSYEDNGWGERALEHYGLPRA